MDDKKIDYTINMYFDESCHLKNIIKDTMSLVTVYTYKVNVPSIRTEINTIKDKYKIGGELKWNKVSNSNLHFYKEIIDYTSNLVKSRTIRIRSTLINYDKTTIVGGFTQWYHKMVYQLFEKVIATDFSNGVKSNKFALFMDKQNKNTNLEVRRTASYLETQSSNSKKINGLAVDSKDFILIQIADIIAGAITYKHRNLISSSSKLELINHIENVFDINLSIKTSFSKLDFNHFVWTGPKTW